MTALVNLTALRELRAKMTPGPSENREPEPCADGVHLHSYDSWPAGSVTAADRKVDQCEWCGWTEVERDQRAAGIVATHAAADTLLEIVEAALAWRDAECTGKRCSHPAHRSPCEILATQDRLDAALAKVSKEGM